MSYKEDLASVREKIDAARQQRAQREYVEQVQTLQSEYRDNWAAREQAAKSGDRAEWDYWDSLCEQNERDLQTFLPAQQPQPDARAVHWDLRNQQYINRVTQRLGPERAMQAMAHVDAIATRHHQRHTPGYQKFVEDYLELHSGNIGVPYDPKEKLLDANEAARISGLSPKHYNSSVQTLMNQGRIGRDD
jgi:hypothetical protein